MKFCISQYEQTSTYQVIQTEPNVDSMYSGSYKQCLIYIGGRHLDMNHEESELEANKS